MESEAALAKLAGIAPVPTGSGITGGRHRVNHGGRRRFDAAIHRTVIVRTRFHQPTIDPGRHSERSSRLTPSRSSHPVSQDDSARAMPWQPVGRPRRMRAGPWHDPALDFAPRAAEVR
ncbi:transposase [Streptomyces cadmiisoli]|uniref:transposase n=1 Tax=Streptomyces cadmiisoli TaxID=2184053 RepID=UPI002482C531|nr:transposase [Streptomyces cadmiisoli]